MAKKMAVAPKHGAQRNGRAARVREYLSQQSTPKTARQILAATEPGGDICLMTAALGTMLRGGQVEKTQRSHGPVLWSLVKQGTPRVPQQPPRDKAAAKPKPARPVARKSADEPVPTPPMRAVPKASAHVAMQPKRALAVASIAHSPPSAGEEAETVEAFQARGGRIDILRPGECSQPLQFDHSDRSSVTPVGPAMHLIGAG